VEVETAAVSAATSLGHFDHAAPRSLVVLHLTMNITLAVAVLCTLSLRHAFLSLCLEAPRLYTT
jgi:hypothetical protein